MIENGFLLIRGSFTMVGAADESLIDVMEVEKTDKKSPMVEPKTFAAFRLSFEETKEPDEKIRLALDFMKEALAQPGGMALKSFWDAKKLCMPVFKEKIHPAKRGALWSEYVALSDEARRLKEMKDEQAAFSIEQIELAIEAVEKDLERYESLVEEGSPHTFKQVSSLSIDYVRYQRAQRELTLLKMFVSRLDSLRKEVLSIDMRISHKNKILKRLSKLGDWVFPKRKELVKEISEAFIVDVETFSRERFPEGEETLKTPYYVIRDEIKGLQGLAKGLTLSASAFTKSRKILSGCWDQIKEKEKERRAEMGERQEEQKKNFEDLLPKVEAFEAFCKEPENQEKNKVLSAARELQEEMRSKTLGREHVKQLKEQIHRSEGFAFDQMKETAEKKKQGARKEIDDLKGRLDQLIQENGSLDALEKEEESLKKIYEGMKLSSFDIHLLERGFASLRSAVLRKKEEAEASEELYEECAVHVEVIREQLEEYRKEMGGTSLDFEKAMAYRELYDGAKAHLEREEKALEDLEEKLV